MTNESVTFLGHSVDVSRLFGLLSTRESSYAFSAS